MNKEQADMLEKLATHLETVEEVKKRFRFDAVLRSNSSLPRQQAGIPECGAVGCALGELIYLFPERFGGYFYSNGYGTVVDKSLTGFDASFFGLNESAQLFGVPLDEAKHLFLPFRQILDEFPGSLKLSFDATPVEVASNMRLFLKLKRERGEITE